MEKITATVKGICKKVGNVTKDYPFEAKVDFELCRTKENDYGTGLYMYVDHHNGWEESVDCRYAGTADIKELAGRYIKNYWGDNLGEYTFG